jgi:hypothetical protein
VELIPNAMQTAELILTHALAEQTQLIVDFAVPLKVLAIRIREFAQLVVLEGITPETRALFL